MHFSLFFFFIWVNDVENKLYKNILICYKNHIKLKSYKKVHVKTELGVYNIFTMIFSYK